MIDDDRGQTAPWPLVPIVTMVALLVAIIAIDTFTGATTDLAEPAVVGTTSPPPLEPFVVAAVLAAVIVGAAWVRTRLRGDRS